MGITSLAYLGFESPNFQEWQTFGPEIFGLAVSPDSRPHEVLLRMDSRHHRIAVRDGAVDKLAYIGWSVAGATELATVVERLEKLGHPVEFGDAELVAERRVVAVAIVEDPAGYRHEIAYGQWYQPNTFAPGRPHAGFVGDDKGIGHVVVVAPTTPEYRAFLIDGLGFKVYAEYPVSFGPGGPTADVLFVRCSERTHCLAVVPIPNMRGIHHFVIEANSLADVGIAYDLVQDRDIPITMTIGSHTIDPVVSFYCRTPSGFDLEFAHGGIDVDDSVIIGKPNKPDIWGHRHTGVGLQTTIVPL